MHNAHLLDFPPTGTSAIMASVDVAAELAVLIGKYSVPQLIAAASAVLALALIVGRVLFNNLPGKRPPILEGIPYIGGLLKFARVRT